VLIDEAAQVLEPTALVPLMAGAKAFVCIGDDKQLPAKVDSREAKRLKFEESLFERLLQAKVVEEDNGFVQLDIQRRMHSSISAFPSRHFYENSVVDGCSDDERPPIDAFAWPQEGSVRVCFVDMQSCGDGEESVGTSKQNTTEAELLEKVLTHILSGGLQPKEVAVVSGYAAQRDLLRRLIPDDSIRIDTVDGFQGMERDLVLVSTARSNMSGKVGFLADPRRANVLLTRARRGLIVFGNYSTLVKEESSWKPWLDWVYEQEAYRTAEGIEKLLC
jgi:superfamily I DNA and/or RNA helicase